MSSQSRECAGAEMEPEPYDFRPQLTDEQWALIADLFRDPAPDPRGGRPRADARRCIEGILWVLRSGSRWKDLPRSFPAYVTCWRRFVAWSGEGIWDRAWRRLVHLLDKQGKVAWKEGFAHGSFAPAKKGVIALALPNVARARSSCCSSMVLACP